MALNTPQNRVKLSGWADLMARIFLGGTLFFLPWFTLSSTSDFSEFPKLLMLLGGVLLTTLCWLGAQFLKGEFKIRRGLLDTPVALSVVLYGASLFFSPDGFASVFGDVTSVRLPFMAWFGFAALYFLINQLFVSWREILWVLAVAALGYTVATIHIILSITPYQGQNLLYSQMFDSLALMPAVAVLGLALASRRFSELPLTIVGWLLGGAATITIFLSGFVPVKLGVLLGLAFLALLSYLNIVEVKKNWLITLGVVGVVMILSFVMPVTGMFRVTIPAETSLGMPATSAITQTVLKQNAVHLLFGEGPNSFRFAWSRFRPVTFNYTSVWQNRFTASGSAIYEFVLSSGLVGLMGLLILIGYVVLLFYRAEQTERFVTNANLKAQTAERSVLGAMLLVLVLATGALFWSGSGLATWLLWWLALAALAQGAHTLKIEEHDVVPLFTNRRQNILIGAAGLVSFGVVLLVTVTYYRYYLGDSLLVATNSANYTTRAFALTRALELNPERPELYVELAKAELDASKSNGGLSDANSLGYRQLLSAMQVAERGTVFLPNSIITWEQLAAVYLALAQASPAGSELVSTAADHAISLEPTNPVWLILKGDALLALGKRDQAVLAYSLAAELKKDWTVPYVKQAAIYAQDKKFDEAIAVALQGAVGGKDDPDYLFFVGSLYFNRGKPGDMNQAENFFNLSLAILPGNRQALMALALTEERLSKLNSALEILQRLLALNASDPEVLKHIRAVRTQLLTPAKKLR